MAIEIVVIEYDQDTSKVLARSSDPKLVDMLEDYLNSLSKKEVVEEVIRRQGSKLSLLRSN